MQATTNASLFQTSYSEALGAYRSRKAVYTSGLSDSGTTPQEARRVVGYPIHLDPRFESAVLRDPARLAEEGSGADGGAFRVLSLRVTEDEGGSIWTSEAGGVVRQLDAESGTTRTVYRGAKAPVPAFDFLRTDAGEQLLVTGSWDRALRIYRLGTPSPLVQVDEAMGDFIKAVHVFVSNGTTYIAVAGSDKSIMLYDATPLTTLSASGSGEVGGLKCVHKYAVHTRPINALTSLVDCEGGARLFSGDSMGRIIESKLSASQRLVPVREMLGFSTAIYSLASSWHRLDADTRAPDDAWLSEPREDDQGNRYRLAAQLWAASGDKSAAAFTLSPSLQPRSPKPSGRSLPIEGSEPALHQSLRLPHRDFVMAVLPVGALLPAAYPLADKWAHAVVTAGADEHIHLHPNPASSADNHVYSAEGHWHQVSSLAAWIRHPKPPANPASTASTANLASTTSTTSTSGAVSSTNPTSGSSGSSGSSVGRGGGMLPEAGGLEVWIVSGGLDGSVRRWNLAELSRLPAPKLVAPSPETSQVQPDWDQDSLPPLASNKLVQMTAEEEAELADLMSDDD